MMRRMMGMAFAGALHVSLCACEFGSDGTHHWRVGRLCTLLYSSCMSIFRDEVVCLSQGRGRWIGLGSVNDNHGIFLCTPIPSLPLPPQTFVPPHKGKAKVPDCLRLDP